MTSPTEPVNSTSDAVRERQDGDYTPPILKEPVGGPVPDWTGPAGTEPTRTAPSGAGK